MSERVVGPGFVLQVGDSDDPATAVFTSLGGIRDIDGPNPSRGVIDVTGQDTTDGIMQKRGGVLDLGQVTFDLMYDPQDAQHMLLGTLLKSGDLRAFMIIDTDTNASETTFVAYVAGLGESRPLEDALTRSVTLEVTDELNYPTAST